MKMATLETKGKSRCGICGQIKISYFAFGSERLCSKCYTPIKAVIVGYIQMLRFKFEVNEYRREQREKQ